MIFLIFIFLAILGIDLPPLIRSRNRREIVVYSLVYLFALALCFLYAAGVEIPSPVMVLGDMMKSVGISY
ncbi:MAG TPA: hypothetical protein DC013_00385 [Ruminococcaceae bacterium]|nr:hypothetical protein [Oscillospiraceae bacterium]